MSAAARVSVHWMVLVVGALVLLAVGAGGLYMGLGSLRPALQPQGRPDQASATVPAGRPADGQAASAPMTSALLPDIAVPLSREGADRAGVTVTAVTTGPASDSLRVPAVVEPNAYALVAVTPLVGGRISRVAVELGQHVTKDQVMAEIFSPDLAEWQTRYISARADLEAHERELARTEKLVQIGSASRQELERIHADHTSRRAGLQSAASRLRLFGLSDAAIGALDPGTTLDATIRVPAPIAGVVTARTANVGQNVEQSTTLFTVVDLSRVWVVADVYEHDFARVQIGSSARVTTSAYPDLVLQARVSYIDAEVSTASRTARVRIEVPNARGELRLGMFVDVRLGADERVSLLIPRTAVQQVGERSVVYLSDPRTPGQFIEREVRLAASTGPLVSVLAGVGPEDVVVTAGSFAIRAERERLGLRPASSSSAAGAPGQATTERVQTATITLGEQGYEPSRVTLTAGVRARLTFIRTTEKTCGTEITFPSLKIKRPLPLNQAVVIEFAPFKAGDVTFTCGMNMLKGTVVVQ